MGLSGCMTCLKYLLFVFNFIFWLAGIAILAVAIYFRVDPGTQSILASHDEKRELFNGVCYVLMAAGGAIMVVGFCGCCGAAQESRMLLSLFAVALFLLLGAEIGAGAYTAVHKDEVTDAIDKAAIDLWKASATVNESAIVVKEIQKELDCCGYYNVGDYCDLNTLNEGNSVIDAAISILKGSIQCATGEKTFLDYCPTMTSVSSGCREKMLEQLEGNITILIAVAITIGLIELMGLVFSILLCQAIGRDYTSGKLA